MEDNDVIYEVHAPMESEELAGKVMRAVGALGAYKIRIYAIEDGRRRPLRQKELAGVLLGATEPEPDRQFANVSADPGEVVESMRWTLSVLRRALFGLIRR